MTDHVLRVSILKGVPKFQEQVPEALHQIGVRAEQGYECVIDKNTEAYLYLDVIVWEDSKQVMKTWYTIIKAEGEKNLIINDREGYDTLYLMESVIAVSDTAVLYNCKMRLKKD